MCITLHLPDGSEVACFDDLRDLMGENPPIDRRYGFQVDGFLMSPAVASARSTSTPVLW